MIVLISDYKEQMFADYSCTIEAVKRKCPEAEICIEPYDTPEFYAALEKAEGLITAFICIDERLLSKAPGLKYISVNAAGYSTIDLAALKKRNIECAHITEYCTREVAEHAFTMALLLNRSFQEYSWDIREKHVWNYELVQPQQTMDRRNVCIFGLGRIGMTTAKLFKQIGSNVYAVDPYKSAEDAAQNGIALVSKEEAFQKGDVLVNHMILTPETANYFDESAFLEMKKRKPVFVNVGRGGSVDENALLKALDNGWIRGAGLDVLVAEDPDLSKCPFVNRRDVVLTPHSAFYSEASLRRLHESSGRSMGLFLTGRADQVEGRL